MKPALRYTCLAVCVFALPAHASDADEARNWLERMTKALANQNYDGRFFHLSGSRTEMMRIISVREPLRWKKRPS